MYSYPLTGGADQTQCLKMCRFMGSNNQKFWSQNICALFMHYSSYNIYHKYAYRGAFRIAARAGSLHRKSIIFNHVPGLFIDCLYSGYCRVWGWNVWMGYFGRGTTSHHRLFERHERRSIYHVHRNVLQRRQ